MQEYHKRYAEQNREAVQKQKKTWYEANKERIAEQEKQRHQKWKQKAESAKKICAAYVFLLALRKNSKPEFLKLYSAQANPLISMLKLCPALQNMDINICPLANCAEIDSNVCEKCSAPNIFSIPGAVEKVKEIVQNLRTK